MTNKNISSSTERYIRYLLQSLIGVSVTSVILAVISIPIVALTIYFVPSVGVVYPLLAVLGISLGALYSDTTDGENEYDSLTKGAGELQDQLDDIDLHFSIRTLSLALASIILIYFYLIVMVSTVAAYSADMLLSGAGVGIMLAVWIPIIEAYVASVRGVAPIITLIIVPVVAFILIIGLAQMILIGNSLLIENMGNIINSMLNSITKSRNRRPRLGILT